MYVCNCNGLKASHVREVLPQCAKPTDVFKKLECRPQCGRCVSDVKQLLQQQKTPRYGAAAE
jgi:bacterioferritin-associated ferredoxin